jgi:tryptophanase
MPQFSAPEPYRIKVVEPLKLTTRSQREEIIRKAHYNIFSIPAENVFVDLMTDSGTSAMSHYQWAGMMTGDESYAGCRNWFHLEETIKDITGFKYVVPTHQGRPAENLLTMIHICPDKAALSNMLFDTTHAMVVAKGGIPTNLIAAAGLDPQNEHPFKGNVDINKLEDHLRRYGRDQVCLLLVTVTCNNNGGQPVSMENLRQVRQFADQYELPFFLDAARFAENAYFIQQREPGYQNKSIKDIAREMFSYTDGCTMSAKKDGLVNIGGFLAMNDEAAFRLAQQYCIQIEGFVTYGGMAGRDLEALSIGLNEVLEEDYMRNRVRQVHFLGDLLHQAGVPTIRPYGGHCVMLDIKRFLPHVAQDDYPGESVSAALYVDSGTRASSLGQLAFGGVDPRTGEMVYAPLELVRLAIPRRVYTDNHMQWVADSVIRVYEQRDQLKGMRILWEPPALRHFSARMEPL